jgi:WD40 repeat protein
MKSRKSLPARKFHPASLALVALCAVGLWRFYPRENETESWRFSPDVSLPGGNSRARSVLFSPDGQTLAVSSLIFPATYPKSVEDRGSRVRRCEVQLWDVSSHAREATLLVSDHDTPRGASDPEMAFSRDGRALQFWGLDPAIWTLWDPKRLPATSSWASPAATQEKFGMPARLPWAGNRDLSLRCRDVAYSSNLCWCAGTFLKSNKALSGEYVVVWRRDSAQKPWQKVGVIPPPNVGSGLVYDLAMSPDGKLLAICSILGPLQIMDTAHLRLVRSLPDSVGVFQTVFSPDSRYLMGCSPGEKHLFRSPGGVLKFWNLQTGAQEHTIASHKLLRNAVFSPDGRNIAAIEGEASVFACPSPLNSVSE